MVYNGNGRPPLVLLMGSRGSYEDCFDVMKNVNLRINNKGAIYFVSHIKPEKPKTIKNFREMGIRLNESTVKDGMPLEKGRFYLHPYAYEFSEYDERDNFVAIEKNGGDGLFFSKTPFHDEFRSLSYTMMKAIEAEYGEDMLIGFLGGCGSDGSEEAVLSVVKTAKPRILVANQVSYSHNIPKNFMRNAGKIGLMYENMSLERMGAVVNDFLS